MKQRQASIQKLLKSRSCDDETGEVDAQENLTEPEVLNRNDVVTSFLNNLIFAHHSF